MDGTLRRRCSSFFKFVLTRAPVRTHKSIYSEMRIHLVRLSCLRVFQNISNFPLAEPHRGRPCLFIFRRCNFVKTTNSHCWSTESRDQSASDASMQSSRWARNASRLHLLYERAASRLDRKRSVRHATRHGRRPPNLPRDRVGANKHCSSGGLIYSDY